VSRDRSEEPALVREIAEWLEGIEGGDTLVASDTIVPPTIRQPTTGGGRALALLEQIAGMSPASTAQLRPGEVIAEGGMGVIRTGEQVALGRTVAVKTLKRARKGDPKAALDLLREAWITGAIEHPNVVPIHHVALDDEGSPVIIMKRISGAAWSELIREPDEVKRRFGAADLLEWNLGILMSVLNALRFAHSRGILHRDLKPDNVMIGEFGEVYLVDWGIAVSLVDDGSGRLPLAANANEPAGTPVYMAPEMLGREGQPNLSERTDVYLAGAVLFEILAGRPPHQGSSALEVLTNALMSKPELPGGVPSELARICVRATQRDPADRHQSALELRTDLQHYLAHRGSARLAALADDRLVALLALLDGGATDPATREQVHRLFGACRFGYHEALASWRDNADARDGLVRATVAVAEYDLACGEAGAAVRTLSELDEPPADILARARAAAAAEDRRRAALEHMRRELDFSIGTRTRTFITAVLGTLFVVLPTIAAVVPNHPMRAYPELYSTAFLVIILLFGWWARQSLMSTAVNRRMFLTIALMFAVQSALVGGALRFGMSLAEVELLMVVIWTVTGLNFAIGVDRRLTPAVIGYLIVFGMCVAWPAQRLYWIVLGNLTFTINAVWVWRPRDGGAVRAPD
jgi:serine/threonine-protein kinase